MPSVQVWVAAPATSTSAPTHRRATLKCGRLSLSLFITSPAVTHASVEPDWVLIPRLGDQPLMRKGNPRMKTMRVEVIFGTGEKSIEPDLALLERIVNEPNPVTVGSYGGLEAGFWWITTMTITSSQREFGTNQMTKATVQLTFTQAPYNSYKISTPTSTTVAPKPIKPTTVTGSTHPKAPARPRTYVVKKGDTLTAIAVRIYGDASKYRAIAAANKIRNPNLIYPGQKLTLP